MLRPGALAAAQIDDLGGPRVTPLQVEAMDMDDAAEEAGVGSGAPRGTVGS